MALVFLFCSGDCLSKIVPCGIKSVVAIKFDDDDGGARMVILNDQIFNCPAGLSFGRNVLLSPQL